MDFNEMLKKQEEVAQNPNVYKEKPSFSKDERFYTISKDADGNGSVVVRFIPSFNKDKTVLNTFLTYNIHSINNEKTFPGADKPEKKWTGELVCPKSHNSNDDCPICNFAWERYNEDKASGVEEKVYKRWLQEFLDKDVIVTNIQVIKDTINPDNNGKIFLFKLSKTVLDMFGKEAEKIKEIIDAGDKDEIEASGIPSDLKVFDPYNLLSSKNMTLKFKAKKYVSQPSDYWGSSYFSSAFTSLVKDTDEYKALVEEAYCLDEFKAESFVTPKETLLKKLDEVTFGYYTDEIYENESEVKSKPEKKVEEKPAISMEEPKVEAKAPEEKPVIEETPVPKEEKKESVVEDDDDAFFADLLNS